MLNSDDLIRKEFIIVGIVNLWNLYIKKKKKKKKIDEAIRLGLEPAHSFEGMIKTANKIFLPFLKPFQRLLISKGAFVCDVLVIAV